MFRKSNAGEATQRDPRSPPSHHCEPEEAGSRVFRVWGGGWFRIFGLGIWGLGFGVEMGGGFRVFG